MFVFFKIFRINYLVNLIQIRLAKHFSLGFDVKKVLMDLVIRGLWLVVIVAVLAEMVAKVESSEMISWMIAFCYSRTRNDWDIFFTFFTTCSSLNFSTFLTYNYNCNTRNRWATTDRPSSAFHRPLAQFHRRPAGIRRLGGSFLPGKVSILELTFVPTKLQDSKTNFCFQVKQKIFLSKLKKNVFLENFRSFSHEPADHYAKRRQDFHCFAGKTRRN